MCNYKRREFIKLSALGFASIALQLNALTTYAQSANGYLGKYDDNTKLNWDAFLERLTQLAKTQHQQPWNQDAYTQKVKKLMLSCDFPEFPNIKKELDSYENKRENWFESAGLYYELDFQVSLFQFEKGEYIPHHDHPDMTGVINVVSGNILSKNYNFEKPLTKTREVISNGRSKQIKSCVVREVSSEMVKKGDVSILTAHEGNIHSIMPQEFTQLVDVFTPAYNQDSNPMWYKLNEEGIYNGQESLFEAEYSSGML